MPDIKDGLTEGPDTGMTDEARAEQALVRAQTQASRNVDSAVQFAPADLLNPEISPSIADGLVSANDPDQVAAREAARLKADNERWYASPEGQAALAEGQAARLAREERESNLSMIERGWMVEQFLNADDDVDRAHILFDTDAATQAEILSVAYGHEPGQPFDEYSQADIAYLRDLYAQSQSEINEANATADRVAAMAQQAAEAVLARDQFIREQGLDPTSPATTARLVALEQVARDAGAPMHAYGRDDFLAALRGADDMMRQSVKAQHDAAFKQSMIDTADTSVRSGLTVNAGFGEVPLVPRPTIQPKAIDSMRLDHAMTNGSPYESADAIRAGILDDSPAKAEYRRVQAEGQRLKGIALDREAEIARALGRR